MFDSLLYSCSIMLGVFTFSTLSAMLLCEFKNKPFCRMDNKFEKKLIDVLSISSATLLETTILTAYIIHPRLDSNENRDFIQGTCNIAMYITIVEFLYYNYHYWIHHSPFYKLVHAKHHESIQVYPMDTFYLEFWDMQILVVVMSVPMFIIKLSMMEHLLTLYYYITVGYLSHSDAFYTHHETHHKYFKCNYCFTLPIVDKIFGTYRE